MPPNATPLLQPMDQEILQNVKRYYKKKLLQRLLDNTKNTILENLKAVNMKDIVFWISDAWTNVSKESLQQSWSKLWPELNFCDSQRAKKDNVSEEAEILKLLRKIPGSQEIGQDELDEWVDDVSAHEVLTDDDIVKIVSGNTQDDDESDESEDDESMSTRLKFLKTLYDTLRIIRILIATI